MPQPFLPFYDLPADSPSAPVSHTAAVSYKPSEEALAAIDRLRAWLTDPRTGRPRTDLAKETLHALNKALVEGHKGWLLAAEGTLEALALRNGRDRGDDIPTSQQLKGPDCHRTIEDLLDALHERVVGRGR